MAKASRAGSSSRVTSTSNASPPPAPIRPVARAESGGPREIRELDAPAAVALANGGDHELRERELEGHGDAKPQRPARERELERLARAEAVHAVGGSAQAEGGREVDQSLERERLRADHAAAKPDPLAS